MPTTNIPDKLRLIDGELVHIDGLDVRDYLKEWAEKVQLTPETPINVVRHDKLIQTNNLAIMMLGWGS